MTILFAGSEQESFETVGPPTFSTSTSHHDPIYSRGALGLRGQGDETLSGSFLATADIWFHDHTNIVADGNAVGSIVTLKGGGSSIVRIRSISTNPGTLNFEYWNGGSWVIIAAAVVVSGILRDIDIHCNIAVSGGKFTLYQGGIKIAEFIGDTTQSGASNVDSFVLGGSFSPTYHSQIIVNPTSTLGMKLKTMGVTADGFSTAWLGGFPDIDEAGLVDLNTAIFGQSDGQEETFVVDDVVIPENSFVKALVISGLVSRGTTGPQNLQFVARSGSTNYPSASVSGIGLGLLPFQHILAVDPDTSLAWDDTSLAAVEIGVKAVT